MTKRFDFFQLFLTVLKRFCPLNSKNVLVLAHLEPELELFEVDDIGDARAKTKTFLECNGQNLFRTVEKS